MITTPVETQGWSRQRWWLTILSVLLLQAALVVLLENPSPDQPRPPVRPPAIHLRESISLIPLAVNDPTLFVLPHREGFSGGAWLNQMFAPNFSPADWTEPLRWLKLSADNLGGNFREFLAANAAPEFQTIPSVEPAFTTPRLFAMPEPPAQSVFQIDGNLAHRRLLAPPELRAWTNADLLTNSVVQLLVNAAGNPVSTVLLSGSGSTEADQFALAFARAAQFEPSAAAAENLTIGTMIFRWTTLPLTVTNGIGPIP